MLFLSARELTSGEITAHFEEASDGGEGARFWLQVFSGLKNRGVEDVLIAVCDGLKGLPEAITTMWERTVVQQYIAHLTRNSETASSRRSSPSTRPRPSKRRRTGSPGGEARGRFPNEPAAPECLYMVTRSLDPTDGGRARWAMRWKPALNAFAMTFTGRAAAAGAAGSSGVRKVP